MEIKNGICHIEKITGVNCNLTEKGKEFLIREENGTQLVLSLELIENLLKIAKMETAHQAATR